MKIKSKILVLSLFLVAGASSGVIFDSVGGSFVAYAISDRLKTAFDSLKSRVNELSGKLPEDLSNSNWYQLRMDVNSLGGAFNEFASASGLGRCFDLRGLADEGIFSDEGYAFFEGARDFYRNKISEVAEYFEQAFNMTGYFHTSNFDNYAYIKDGDKNGFYRGFYDKDGFFSKANDFVSEILPKILARFSKEELTAAGIELNKDGAVDKTKLSLDKIKGIEAAAGGSDQKVGYGIRNIIFTIIGIDNLMDHYKSLVMGLDQLKKQIDERKAAGIVSNPSSGGVAAGGVAGDVQKKDVDYYVRRLSDLANDFATYMGSADPKPFVMSNSSGLQNNQILSEFSRVAGEFMDAYPGEFADRKIWWRDDIIREKLLTPFRSLATKVFSGEITGVYNEIRDNILIVSLDDLQTIVVTGPSDNRSSEDQSTVAQLFKDVNSFSRDSFFGGNRRFNNQQNFSNNLDEICSRLIALAGEISTDSNVYEFSIVTLRQLDEKLEVFLKLLNDLKSKSQQQQVAGQQQGQQGNNSPWIDEGKLADIKGILSGVFEKLKNGSGAFGDNVQGVAYHESIMKSVKDKLAEVYSVLNNGQKLTIKQQVDPKAEEFKQQAESVASFGKNVFLGGGQNQSVSSAVEDFLGMLNFLTQQLSQVEKKYYKPCLEKMGELLKFIASNDFNLDVVKEQAPQIKEAFSRFFSFDPEYIKHQNLYVAVLDNLDERKQAIKRGLIEEVEMSEEEFKNCKRLSGSIYSNIDYVVRNNVVNESILTSLRKSLASLNSLFKKYYDKGKTQGTYMDAYAVSSQQLSGLMKMARKKTHIFSADGGVSRAVRLKLWNLIADFCRLNPNANSQESSSEWFNESYEQVLEEEARVERINKNKKEKGAEKKNAGQKKGKIKFKFVKTKGTKGKNKDKKNKGKLKSAKEKLKPAKEKKEKAKDGADEGVEKKELKVQLPKQSLKKFVGSKDKIKIVKKRGVKRKKKVGGKLKLKSVDKLTLKVRRRVADAFSVFAKRFLRKLENSKGAYDLNDQFMPVISELKESKHEDYESDLDKIELLVAGFSKFAKMLRKSPEGSFNRDMGRFFNKVLVMFTSADDRKSSGVSDAANGSFYEILDYISNHDKGEGLTRKEANEVFDLVKKFKDNYKVVLEGMKKLGKKKKKKKKKRIVAKELKKIKKEKVS